jgi:hypothetical protein
MKKYLYLVAAMALAVTLALALPTQDATKAKSGSELRYRVMAKNPRLNRRVFEPVADDVRGVPAEPVDSFVWDGVGSVPIKGTAKVDIDPVNNTGTITAHWQDQHGTWKFTQTAYAAPDHASGLRLGPGAEDTQLVIGDPVPVNVYLHGDTTAGGPVLPTIFNYMATWGPAEVTLNGKPFENPYDGPAPLWVAHTMTTVGVRGPDGTVRRASDPDALEGYFDALEDPTDGLVDYDDMEFHLVFHDAPGPEMTDNFPPPFSFFYHLTFEDVKLSIDHVE